MSEHAYRKQKEAFDERTSLGTLKDYNDLLLGMNSCTTGADAKLFNRYTYLGNRNFSEIQFINFDLHELMSASLDRKLAQWMKMYLLIFPLMSEKTRIFQNIYRYASMSFI